MIKSKYDLQLYLKKDKEALEISRKRPKFFGDEIWKYEIALRKHEYFHNILNKTKNPLSIIGYNYYRFKHHYLGLLLGFEIPINVFGKGLRINHHGYIVVNSAAKVGDFCDIHQGVHIGSNLSEYDVPRIGNNVWIGPGTKIFGKIIIGNEVMIGAGSVVNRSFPDDKITIAGIPAKEVKSKGNPWVRK